MSVREIKLDVQAAAKSAAAKLKADGYCGRCDACFVSMMALATLFLRAMAREYGHDLPVDMFAAAIASVEPEMPPPSGGCVN